MRLFPLLAQVPVVTLYCLLLPKLTTPSFHDPDMFLFGNEKKWQKVLRSVREPFSKKLETAQAYSATPFDFLEFMYEYSHKTKRLEFEDMETRALLCLRLGLEEKIPALRDPFIYYADKLAHRSTLKHVIQVAKGDELPEALQFASIPSKVPIYIMQYGALDVLPYLYPRSYGKDREAIVMALAEALKFHKAPILRIKALESLLRVWPAYRGKNRNYISDLVAELCRTTENPHFLQHGVWFLRDSKGPIIPTGENYVRRTFSKDSVELRKKVEAVLNEKEPFYIFKNVDHLAKRYGKGPVKPQPIPVEDKPEFAAFKKSLSEAMQTLKEIRPKYWYMICSAGIRSCTPIQGNSSFSTYEIKGEGGEIHLQFGELFEEKSYVYIPVLMHEVQHIYSNNMGLEIWQSHRREEEPFFTEFLMNDVMMELAQAPIEYFHDLPFMPNETEVERASAFVDALAARGHWKAFQELQGEKK